MENIFHIVGSVIIGIGIVFMLLGVVGIFKFKSFFTRILITSKVDTVGTLTIMIGIAVMHGVSFFSAKILFLLLIILLLNPLVVHIVTKSAYLSGEKVVEPNKNKEIA
jgi:multicomponent Na+:H+ antiporter subunit G